MIIEPAVLRRKRTVSGPSLRHPEEAIGRLSPLILSLSKDVGEKTQDEGDRHCERK